MYPIGTDISFQKIPSPAINNEKTFSEQLLCELLFKDNFIFVQFCQTSENPFSQPKNQSSNPW